MELVQALPTKLISLIEIQTDPLICMQIIPHFNITNGVKIEKIINGLHALDTPIFQRLKILNNKLIYTPKIQFHYSILIENNNISFYYLIPESIKDWFTQRVYSSWTNMVTIIPAHNYLTKFTTPLEWILKPKYPTFKSLRDDYRDTPIPSILSISNDLSDNDRVLLEFTFSPIHESFWKEQTLVTQQKYRKGLIEDSTQTGTGWFVLNSIMKIIDTIFELSNIIFEVKPKKRTYYYSHRTNEILESYNPNTGEVKYNTKKNQLSSASRQKINHNGFKGKLRILSQSDDPVKRNIYAKTMNVALRELYDDNEFTIQSTKIQQVKPMKINFLFDNFIYSSKEIGQLIQLPTKQWQEEYPVEKVDVQEINIPKELFKGKIPIGEYTFKGIKNTVYWPEDTADVLSMPRIIIGPPQAGKTEYTKNFVYNAYKRGDASIVFDYIKDNDLADSISKVIPDALVFDLSKDHSLFALAYPEVISNKNDKWNRLVTANILSRQVETLINSIITDTITSPLSTRMSRYLDAACKVVFIHNNKKISDVLSCLTNHIVRDDLIKQALESGCFLESDDEIIDLLSLNETNKKGNVIGTIDNKIDHILDRSNMLSRDIFLRNMMKAPINLKLNFSNWMDEGKTIIFKMPEKQFTDKRIKDTIMTYFMSRVWLAAQQRKDFKRICHIVTDEIHQIPTCASLIARYITEPRKFGISYYFTIHYLRQFKTLLEGIKSAGVSYMLLAGTEKENFMMLEEEFEPFTIKNLMELKPYHSINRINVGNEYIKFISKLPNMLE